MIYRDEYGDPISAEDVLSTEELVEYRARKKAGRHIYCAKPWCDICCGQTDEENSVEESEEVLEISSEPLADIPF